MSIFTQEQINEIERRLALRGAKDTGLPLAGLPFTGEETIAIVQQGINKRANLARLLEGLEEYKENAVIADFFNVSVYNAGSSLAVYQTLNQAIAACPTSIKKVGIVITFFDGADWKLWQYAEDTLDNWSDPTKWKNIGELSDKASTETFGIVKIGDNLSVNDGVISVPVAGAEDFGVIIPGTGLTTNNGTLNLKKATNESLGGVIIDTDNGLDYNTSGVVKVKQATANTLGGVKVGSGLSIDANGVLSVTDEGDNAVVDTTLNILKVTAANNDTYYCNVTKLVKPSAPTITGSGNHDVVPGSTHTITISNISGGVVYYTTDGSTPTTNSSHSNTGANVSVQLSVSADAESTPYTIKAIIVKAGESSNVSTASVTLYRKLATPVISASDNKYSLSRTVTMTCAQVAGTIKYTDNGTTPTAESSTYSAGITASSTTTFKAIAVADNWKNSEVADSSVIVGTKKMYRGLLDPSTAAPTTEAGIIAALEAVEQDALPLIYEVSSSQTAQKKVCVAYDSTLEDLAHIKDGANQEYIGQFTKSTHDGYNIYCMNTAANQGGMKYTFSLT